MLNGLRLDIEGFGLINDAHIEIGKINVVGGVNASGKSTASKLLYCFLKAMSLNRKDYLLAAVLPKVNEFVNYMEKPHPYLENDLPDKFTVEDDFEEICRAYIHARNIYSKIGDDFFEVPYEILGDLVFELDRIFNILLNKEEYGFDVDFLKFEDNDDFFINRNKAYSSVVKSLFKNESLLDFKGKSHFYSGSFNCHVSYEETDDFEHFRPERGYGLKAKNLEYDDFDYDFIYSSDGDFNFLNEVFYIDSISFFDLDYYISSKNKITDVFGYKEHVEYLLKQLKSEKSSDLSDETVKKMDDVQKQITDIIGGFCYRSGELYLGDKIFNEGYYFQPEDTDDAYNVNISSGIQQISIIQILLENYKLHPGSFLILDEPEVNLHPEWQFKFAEILVLLAKELDITIYLNSHSPMFIEAIEVLTQYYDMEGETNFYLTEKSENKNSYDFAKIEYDELYRIYDNLAKPFDIIEVYRLKNDYKNGNY